MANEFTVDPDQIYQQYASATQGIPFTANLPNALAVTTINGVSGPSIVFNGTAAGFSFAPSGPSVILSGPLTTKGDLYTRSSTTGTRKAVGTEGQALFADPADTTGLTWSTAERRVASVVVNLNSAVAQDLYTVPGGKSFVTTKVIARSPSVDLGAYAGNISFMDSGGSFVVIDSIASTSELNNSSQFLPAPGFSGAEGPYMIVPAGNKVQAIPSAAFGSAATVVIDLWGYLI